MYLIDTNVWLERLLDQERSKEVGDLFIRVSSEQFFLTDFSFHSIGIVLTKLKQTEGWMQFVRDILIDGTVTLIYLDPHDMLRLVEVMKQFNLDFDDAYQYTSAEKYKLTLVSFDADFERTERKMKTPVQI